MQGERRRRRRRDALSLNTRLLEIREGGMRGDRGQRDIEEVAVIEEVARREVQRDEGGDEGGLEVVMVRYGSRRILLYAVMLFVKMKQNDWLIS